MGGGEEFSGRQAIYGKLPISFQFTYVFVPATNIELYVLGASVEKITSVPPLTPNMSNCCHKKKLFLHNLPCGFLVTKLLCNSKCPFVHVLQTLWGEMN